VKQPRDLPAGDHAVVVRNRDGIADLYSKSFGVSTTHCKLCGAQFDPSHIALVFVQKPAEKVATRHWSRDTLAVEFVVA